MSFGLLSYLSLSWFYFVNEGDKISLLSFLSYQILGLDAYFFKREVRFLFEILFDYFFKKMTFLLGNSLPERSIPVYPEAIIASFL